MALIRLDLPAPLGPRTTTISPADRDRSAAHDRHAGLVPGLEIADFEDGLASCRASEIGLDATRGSRATSSAVPSLSNWPLAMTSTRVAEPRHHVDIVLDQQEGDAASVDVADAVDDDFEQRRVERRPPARRAG